MTATIVIGLLLALSTVTIGTAIGWCVAAAGASVVRRLDFAAVRRAALLSQIRLLPLALPAIFVPSQVIAFARFEVGGEESAGPLLLTLAAAGAVLCIAAFREGLAMRRDTDTIVSAWRATATPLTLPLWTRPAWTIRRRFPVVAVVGILRPQLFVARQVTDTCSTAELTAIAAHESAHVAAGDNLLRLLFRVTPGVWACRRFAALLEHAWAAAAEDAADARATSSASPVDLASALTKVARLAGNQQSDFVPASALIDGSDLHQRVVRLLGSRQAERSSLTIWVPAAALVAVAVLLQTAPISAGIHELLELLVRRP